MKVIFVYMIMKNQEEGTLYPTFTPLMRDYLIEHMDIFFNDTGVVWFRG